MNNTPLTPSITYSDLENQCAVCRSENQALKAVVDELSRKLYEVAPQSTITFNARDLALSNLLLIPSDSIQ